MADSAHIRERPRLTRTGPRLLRAAAVGGLLGGLLMFFVLAGYNASSGMGFLTILNVCFAAWVFRGTSMRAAAPPGGRSRCPQVPWALPARGWRGRRGWGSWACTASTAAHRSW